MCTQVIHCLVHRNKKKKIVFPSCTSTNHVLFVGKTEWKKQQQRAKTINCNILFVIDFCYNFLSSYITQPNVNIHEKLLKICFCFTKCNERVSVQQWNAFHIPWKAINFPFAAAATKLYLLPERGSIRLMVKIEYILNIFVSNFHIYFLIKKFSFFSCFSVRSLIYWWIN